MSEEALKQETFQKELQHLINRHSQENASNTPDFILAQYLVSCLLALNLAVQQRETWYGRHELTGGPKGVHSEPGTTGPIGAKGADNKPPFCERAARKRASRERR